MAQRTWFITGVTSGFGRHMTEQLLARGDRVAGTIRKLEPMRDLQSRYRDLLWLAYLDMTDRPSIRRVVNQAFADLGRIDVVVNNAGYGLIGAAEELTDEQIDHQIDTNLVGSIQVVRAALPHLRAQGGGRIIQLSSVGGQAVYPGGSLYHATKWGIEGFLEATMLDLAPFGIDITIVEPGGARTQFAFSSIKLGPKLDAYAISPAVASRRIIEEGTRVPPGDPAKMAQVMIDSAGQSPAPKRIVLGSDAYTMIHKALTERLASLEAQKPLALSTDLAD
ncbi:MAG TPA: SDR family oxidoreductase [Aliidongia sp.]|nr:SDR family oxidoreductase [Aliidongia sp.]